MTMDRTLKIHGGLARARSVLTRTERIQRLTDEGKFDPDQNSPFGLPKTRVHHSKVGVKAKKAEQEDEETPEAPAATGEEKKGK